MQEIAYGQLGMSRRDFWESTARELFNAIRGYYENQMYYQRQAWERTRWMTCLLVNTQTTRPVQPHDLIKFEWEKEEKKEVKLITQDELRKLADYYDKSGR